MQLPEFSAIVDKKELDEQLTPLEKFIYNNEPCGDSCGADFEWRIQLLAALNWFKEELCK